jgi:hypothetical protein
MKKTNLPSMVFALGLLTLAFTAVAYGAAPQMLNYQGRLTGTSGDPVSGTYSMTFAIYDDSTGGNPIWSEASDVYVNEGIFSVILGSQVPIDDTVFAEPDRWLQLAVEGEDVVPRTRLTSVAYSHRVSTVDGASGGIIQGDLRVAGDLGGERQPALFVIGQDDMNLDPDPGRIQVMNDNYEVVIDLDGWVGGRATLGPGNTNTGEFSFVAGSGNTAEGSYHTVGGGTGNIISGDFLSTIGGGHDNSISGNWSTIGGGKENVIESNGTIAGGSENAITAQGGSSAIGGGHGHTASGAYGTVAGGNMNTVGSFFSTVGGGAGNTASNWGAAVCGGTINRASGWGSTIGGGETNTASGSYATVPGGNYNVAGGFYSFAAGRKAKANDDGAFVWADTSDFDFTSVADNEFAARATGGVRFVTGIDGTGAPNAGVQVAAGGGSWSSISDRNLKENFALVDTRELLERIALLPISSWNYKAQNPSIRHIGPMAQDFYAAFDIGEDNTHITTIDPDGVALAGIQALYNENQLQREEIEMLKAQLAEMEALLHKLLEDR